MDDLERATQRPRPPTAGGQRDQFEFRVITMPRGTTRGEVRQVLTDHAEYGRWELARVRLYGGGVRRVWLRRRILRVDRSAGP